MADMFRVCNSNKNLPNMPSDLPSASAGRSDVFFLSVEHVRSISPVVQWCDCPFLLASHLVQGHCLSVRLAVTSQTASHPGLKPPCVTIKWLEWLWYRLCARQVESMPVLVFLFRLNGLSDLKGLDRMGCHEPWIWTIGVLKKRVVTFCGPSTRSQVV